ncbi:aminotransferase class III-fold pyridoxal phosphate-dependent enzyme [Bradyrhizobium elkanii]|uniref:aminotransferase class III-fold pyridoxal phosphate-dependent enzyme n=1 Tax=Bradyrhizobium elkanii TaxID=29448 RepID=UPI0030B83824
MRRQLETIASDHGSGFAVRGRGVALGFDCQKAEIAEGTTRKAFEKGLIVERCKSADQVIKVMPALTIYSETLNQGFEIFEECLAKQ